MSDAHNAELVTPPGTAAALSLALRRAARNWLGLAEGDYWPSEIAAEQAQALLNSGWVVIPPAEVPNPGCVQYDSCESGDHTYSWPCALAEYPRTSPDKEN